MQKLKEYVNIRDALQRCKGVPEAKKKIYQMGIWIHMKNDDHPKW